MDFEKLAAYLNKVVVDAYLDEHRSMDASLSAWVVDGDVLFIYLPTKYERVRTRVLYRLENNLKRNSGLTLGEHMYIRHQQDAACLVMDDYCVQAGYTVGEIRIDGRVFFINLTAIGSKAHRLKHGLNKGTCTEICEAAIALQNAMHKVGGKAYYYDNLDTAYETFRQDYRKAFGELPVTFTIERVL